MGMMFQFEKKFLILMQPVRW